VSWFDSGTGLQRVHTPSIVCELTFASSLTIFFSKVVDFVLEKYVGLTLKELKAGLLGVENDPL